MPKRFSTPPSHRKEPRLTASALIVPTETAKGIRGGVVTAHRRPVMPSDHSKRYYPGQKLLARNAIRRRKREDGDSGQWQYEPIATCRILVTKASKARLSALTMLDARAEGFRTTADFKANWLRQHDKRWFAENADEDGTVAESDVLERFERRHAHKQVWVLRFEVDREEKGRFLAASSPLMEGGKARLLSPHKVKPRPAQVREMDQNSDEAHGYTTSPFRGARAEPQPIDDKTQAKYTAEGFQGWVAREKEREQARESLVAWERLRQLQEQARVTGADIGHIERSIIERIRKGERKLYRAA